MTIPIERFKNSYVNWRWNPFTSADMATDKEEDHLFIPGSSPYVIQLLEQPRKNDPTSITVYCYDDVADFTEVAGAPAQSQFRVDYPPDDGEGTGLVEFNNLDAGKEVKVNYKATGSPALSEFLDTKVSYPAGNPADHQIIGFVSGAPDWRYNPICYFHDGNVIYHASGEDESCLLFRFKKTANQDTIILELKGAKLHQGYYTELFQHNHAAGTLVNAAASNHSHAAAGLSGSQAVHSHGISGNTGNENSDHHHAISLESGGSNLVGGGAREYNHTGAGGDLSNHDHMVTGNSDVPNAAHKHNAGLLAIGDAGNEAVTIAGSTSNAGNHNHVISGDVANEGVTAKTYPDQLKVYINGVDKTTDVLALTGLTQFGDGTDSHAFVTTGSGEMDISALVAANQFHEIKITEPTSAKGSRVLLHLEVY